MYQLGLKAVGQRPKSGFHLYKSGPDSAPQALGDEKTEFYTPGG
jgi:hypothetical protein